jgi:hypothetical protein
MGVSMYFVLTILLGFLLSCDKQGSKAVNLRTAFSSPTLAGGKSGGDNQNSAEDKGSAIPLTDEEAQSYFKAYCASCHGKGDQNTPKGSFTSFWSFDPNTYDLEAVRLDPDGAKVYQSIVHRITSSKETPAAMPPPEEPYDQIKTERLFSWYKSKAPNILKDVHLLYPDGAKVGANDVKIDLTFKCSSPATFREYLRRVTNDAFSREPTLAELSLAGPDPDIKVEQKHRDLVKARLASEWKAEFVEKGLKKFAYKVAGSNAINYSPELNEDLKDEFYQLLKYGYDTTKYRDLLLGPSSMVSAKTASEYGCTPPSTGWQLCKMTTPRQGYFTSLSFLASKPSSFLIENNNYGRMAMAHFMIHGQSLEAATNGPVGEVVNPIPSCFKSADRRGLANVDGSVAPRGTISVPESGNICQTCHLDRNLASASILFRNFNTKGQLFNPFNLSLDPDYEAATKEPWVVQEAGGSKPVTLEFLQSLILGTNEIACVTTGKNQKIVSSVNDLMAEIVGDGSILSKGLARHMARSLSNLSTISLDTLESTRTAFEASGGKLEMVFQSYFGTETYSCMKEVK